MRTTMLAGTLLLSLFVSAQVCAEVREVKEGSFHVESTLVTDASPAVAYRALIRIPEWWDPAHTWSGLAKNLTLEPRAGGCFCEKLADGGSVQHARVIFAQPGKMLRLDGALGPLQDMAATGILTFTLAPEGSGTRINLSYRVAGALTMEPAQLAPLVDQVLGGQFQRLREFANAQVRR